MNILLVCSAGMSTSMLVKKMEDSAKEQGIEAKIWAVGVADGKEEIPKADIVLLGPQVRFLENQMKKNVNNEKPVMVIEMLSYGRLDGKTVLAKAIEAIDNFKK